MRREGRERLLDRLLVTDIGVYALEQRQLCTFGSRNVQSSLSHRDQQSNRFEGDCFAARVGAGNYENMSFGR